MHNIMLVIAPAITNPYVVWGVALALVVWAVASGLNLLRASRQLSAALRRATSVLERSPDERAFAQDYESVANELKSDPILGTRWREYDDSLVARHKPVPHYRSTTRSSRANASSCAKRSSRPRRPQGPIATSCSGPPSVEWGDQIGLPSL